MGTDLHQPRWKKVAWYAGLTALGVVVLFPIYMTFVRAISQPRAYVIAGQPPWPVHVEWDVFSRAFTDGDLGRKFLVSAVVTVLIVAGQLITATLAAYAFTFLAVPVPAGAVLRVHGHADAAHRGHPDPERADHPVARLAQLLPGARRRRSSPPPSARSCCARASGASPATCSTPPSSTATATWPSCAASPSPSPGRWSPRSGSSPSSPPGTSTPGPGPWSPRAAGRPSRSACATSPPRAPTRTTSGFAAALLAALPIVLLLIFLQRQLVRGLTTGAVKG